VTSDAWRISAVRDANVATATARPAGSATVAVARRSGCCVGVGVCMVRAVEAAVRAIDGAADSMGARVAAGAAGPVGVRVGLRV